MPQQVQITPLETADTVRLQKELGLVDPKAPLVEQATVDPELAKQAGQYADQLLSNMGNLDAEVASKNSIEEMGRSIQKQAAIKSAMLRQPIKNLYRSGEEGSETAVALVDLRISVERLDPNSLDLTPGWGTRLLGRIPGVGTPLKRYFMRYESAETHLQSIMGSLDKGKTQLKNDIITLTVDQLEMRKLTIRLQKTVELGRLIDQKLEEKLANMVEGDEKTRFVKEELLFPLRQRIQDLQQQLIVNQQGVLALEIVIRNNKELIRGIYRAQDVTMSALTVAVTVALALANQKIQLDKILKLNATTSKLIESTGKNLRSQGVEIQKMASSTMLDMNALKSAFTDIKAAMDDLSRFRQEALPQMAQAILDMDKMSIEQEEVIRQMEKGRKAQGAINIEVK